MHNPVKGEGVEIEISGKSYPLIFSFDAIAKVEAEHDRLITEVQLDMPRVSVILCLLNAALVGFDGELSGNDDLPPIIETQLLIQKALHIAYFGNELTEELEKEDAKKDAKKKK